MSDLQKLVEDVTEWHVGHFGREPKNCALGKKLIEEAGELAELLEWDYQENPPQKVRDECADMQILLCAIAGRNGIDLEEEARKKLEVVRNRDQKARDRERGIPV